MKIGSLSKRSLVIVMSSLLLPLLLADFSSSIIAKSPNLQAGIEPPQFMSHSESATLQEDGHITGTVTDSDGNPFCLILMSISINMILGGEIRFT